MIRWYWDLSIALAKTDFKLRHEGSYLGMLWYLLNPLIMFLILLFVFSSRFGNNIPNYPAYLLLGIIMYNFFQQITNNSSKILQSNRQLIKSVKFPLWTLIVSTVIRNFYSHILEIAIFLIFMIYFEIPIWGIFIYPLILIFYSIFTLGVSLTLSSLSIYFSDIENIWLFFSRLLFFITPIIYSIGEQKILFFINIFNPLYYFIQVAREVLIYGNLPELWLIFGMIFYTFLSLFIGILFFNFLKFRIPELI